MEKLEVLLNRLIEKGWKPRNIECTGVKSTDYCLEFYTELKTIGWISKDERHLVSKESGLWQFVCEKGMINIPGYKSIIRQGVDAKRHKYYGKDYRYWLCESALIDDCEIEDFLLSNIKIGD